MNKNRLWLLALVPLMAACGVNRGYHADPVVGPDDPRETDTPDMGDREGRDAQQCFVIEIYAYGNMETNDENEGIACLVTPSTSTTTQEVPK